MRATKAIIHLDNLQYNIKEIKKEGRDVIF